jgi:hypothetical protein
MNNINTWDLKAFTDTIHSDARWIRSKWFPVQNGKQVDIHWHSEDEQRDFTIVSNVETLELAKFICMAVRTLQEILEP